MNIMGFAVFLKDYVLWHYGEGIKNITALGLNFLRFENHFFSQKLLLKTLFSPYRRMQERYKKGFDVEAFLESAIINFITRLVGFLLRSVILLASGVANLFTIIAIPIALVLWIFLPLLIVALLIAGFYFL